MLDTAASSRRALTKGQRTRERLLRAAVDRFGAQGYRATSVSQLSRDAGLTPAAAYAYFADKDACWAAAVTADLDDLAEQITARAMSSSRPLYELMSLLVQGLHDHPLARRVMVEGTPADLNLVLQHHLFAGTTSMVARGLRARQALGVLSADADPDVLARGIETVMFSMVLSTVRAGLDEEPERIASVLEVLRLAVGGAPNPEEIIGGASPARA
ncbi:MAG: TetR/AcrR family transcriptional regulator [Actinobacteria bacterium]|nr:TetR/AcrR family transcriptional regulator [Actinomycetota bacterium]